MKLAQIQNGIVHYIFESLIWPEFSDDIHLVDISEIPDVSIGWRYDGFVFYPPDGDIPQPPSELDLKLAQNTADTVELIFALDEFQKLEQAQANAELIELMMTIGGML